MSGSTWDCHAHVFGAPDRFPLREGREYDPPRATLEDYLGLLGRHGITHGVLVQPSAYGFDNRCLLDALARADGRLAGVAVPDPASTPRDLEGLHARGVRAVRCNLISAGGLGPGVVARWAPVLRALGWHVELHAHVEELPELGALSDSLGVPVVVDHMGRPRLRWDGMPPAFERLVEAVRTGACLVKLSAPYRFSNEDPPWADVTPLARTLLAANPTGCVWATDWPHVFTDPGVDADDLFVALEAWCPDPAARGLLLGETPRRLYGGG